MTLFKDRVLEEYYEKVATSPQPPSEQAYGQLYPFSYSLYVLGVLERFSSEVDDSGFKNFCRGLHPFFHGLCKQGLISAEFLVLLNTQQIHVTKGFESLDRLIEELNKVLDKQYVANRDLREKILRQR